ncbi:GNAT family N-acetyltransferase [Amycolatopsis sp. H20-H5]|uniref:GNAT family N-acetyltransferase n=1 Tax=Amycolatopsis sp. H20-H5 TaxID=3046309 RepID=UPI002DBF9EB0|nr:GNAT family N-acetyltransferase [Amycolatopsis sp. H20-H5]MEC3981171.1 GNAT family N-acetyltransferase [Amycolatopsis sp. H20-H5]
MELTWRPLTPADMDALAVVFAEAEAAEPTGEHYSAEDLREQFDGPSINLLDGSTAAWAGDRLVGYGLVRPRDAADPVHMPRLEALMHPDHRSEAVGHHLTDWFLRAGRLLHLAAFPDAPLELHSSAHENQRWFAEVLAAAGYQHQRTFVDMRTEPGTLPPVQPLPPELPLVAHEEKYEELTRLARNDIFAGHWGSTEQSPENWRHLVTGSKDFRRDLSFLLLSPSGDEVVAFVLSSFYESEAAITGVKELYVNYVGTRASLRGRGVATALLGYTMAKATEAGFERYALNVDVDNAHSALGVYERCGYRVTDRWAGYVLPVG